MQWEVAGTHGVTGQARSIVVNADDAAQARRLGARRGWTVESVHPVEDPKPPVAAGGPLETEAPRPQAPAATLPIMAAVRAGPPVGMPDRVTVGARRLDRAAAFIGILGGGFVFIGVLLVAGAAAPTRTAGGSLVTGLATGLPVIAVGVLQAVAALVVHVLADLARAVGELQRDSRGTTIDPSGESRARAA